MPECIGGRCIRPECREPTDWMHLPIDWIGLIEKMVWKNFKGFFKKIFQGGTRGTRGAAIHMEVR